MDWHHQCAVSVAALHSELFIQFLMLGMGLDCQLGALVLLVFPINQAFTYMIERTKSRTLNVDIDT
jgi:hypothetical protein